MATHTLNIEEMIQALEASDLPSYNLSINITKEEKPALVAFLRELKKKVENKEIQIGNLATL